MILLTDAPSELSKTRASALGWAILLVALSMVSVLTAYERAMHFSGVAIDGPFQLYNALRRIQGGFRPGVDFQFFHGLGVAYLHYPFFRALGGGLRGSEIARELIAAASFPLVFLLVFRAFAGSWTKALCLAAAAMAAAYALHLSAVLFAVNGMLGVRSASPALVAIALYVSPGARARAVATGLALALSLALGTEQGLAVVVAYLAISLVAMVPRGDRRAQIIETLATVAIGLGAFALFLLSVGGMGGLTGALRYNFRTVPMDQYWFFGAPPNVFVPSWSAGLRMAISARPVGLALALSVVAIAVFVRRLWRSSGSEEASRNFALATYALYGLVSCASLLGVFTFAYVQPCWRVLLILAGLELLRASEQFDVRRAHAAILGVPRGLALAALVMTLWTASQIGLIASALTETLPHVVSSHFMGGGRWGVSGIWPETLRDGQAIIDHHRGSAGEIPTLWSTYSGWIEARNGVFNPSFDYAIHALGPENRAAYLAKFRANRPALVQTVDPRYTPYEAWIENSHWDLYLELLRNYEVAGTTPWSIFWERRVTLAPGPIVVGTMQVPPGMVEIRLPPVAAELSGAITLLQVDVDYSVHNPLGRLPIIGGSPRYLVAIDSAVTHTPVSLDPYVTTARFPVLIRRGQTPILRLGTFSLLPGAGLTVHTLRVSVVPVTAANQLWLSALYAGMLE
jgi:hypothetical protein